MTISLAWEIQWSNIDIALNQVSHLPKWFRRAPKIIIDPETGHYGKFIIYSQTI